MMRTFYSIGILLFLSLPASAKIYVYGRVIGSDGKTMTMANVILTYPGDNRPINEVAVGRGGEYRIAIDSEGLWTVHFIGAFHHSYMVALYVNSTKDIKLDVRLTSYDYEDNFSQAAVVRNFDDWSLHRAIRMKEDSNGTYSAIVRSESDTVFYRLVNVRTGGLVEGSDADGFQQFGIDGYCSFIRASNGQVRITFDPREFKMSHSRPGLRIEAGTFSESKFAEAFAIYRNEKYNYDSSLYRHIAGFQMGQFKFSFKPAIDSVKGLIKPEHNRLIRQVLQLDYFGLKAMNSFKHYVDVKTSRQTLEVIPPNSFVWSLDPDLLPLALDQGEYRAYNREEYVHKVVDTNPMTRTKVVLLHEEIDTSIRSIIAG